MRCSMNFNSINDAMSFPKICPHCKTIPSLSNGKIRGNKLKFKNLCFKLDQRSSYVPGVYPQSVQFSFRCPHYEAKFLVSYHQEGTTAVLRNILLEKEIYHLDKTVVINHATRSTMTIKKTMKSAIKKHFDVYGTLAEVLPAIS